MKMNKTSSSTLTVSFSTDRGDSSAPAVCVSQPCWTSAWYLQTASVSCCARQAQTDWTKNLHAVRSTFSPNTSRERRSVRRIDFQSVPPAGAAVKFTMTRQRWVATRSHSQAINCSRSQLTRLPSLTTAGVAAIICVTFWLKVIVITRFSWSRRFIPPAKSHVRTNWINLIR